MTIQVAPEAKTILPTLSETEGNHVLRLDNRFIAAGAIAHFDQNPPPIEVVELADAVLWPSDLVQGEFWLDVVATIDHKIGRLKLPTAVTQAGLDISASCFVANQRPH